MGALQAIRRHAKTVADAIPAVPTAVEYAYFRMRHPSRASWRNAPDAELLSRIDRDGFAVLPDYFSADECRTAIDELRGLLLGEHVRQAEDLRVHGAEELSPSAARFYGDTRLQAIANHYSRAKTINAFTLASEVTPERWTTAEDAGWHRDLRFRQFKAFLFLSEVTQDNGPLQVIRGSHRIGRHLRDVQRGALAYTKNWFHDAQIQRIVADEPDRLVSLTGGPGMLVLADTGMLHRGSPPRSGARYAFTNYYLERDQVRGSIKTFRPVNPGKLERFLANW